MWQSLKKVLHKTETLTDKLSRSVQNRLNRDTDVTIMPYVGYGNPHHVRLRGRVLENHRVEEAQDGDNALRNLRNIVRRFRSHELPHVELTITFAGQEQTVVTNDEGFFYAEFNLEEALDKSIYTAQFHYEDEEREAQAKSDVIITLSNAQFAVVSDMDDTVIRSNVPNRIKLVANTLFKNARTRLPFPGVAEFYRALQKGTQNTQNPIYYVSNSPYNLYDLLHEFFDVRGIPHGPIFLRDFGLTERYLGAERSHKTVQISRLLELHPDLPFILIGDSGEHDPDIYAEVVKQYPNRILAIYIRDVRPGKEWKVNERVEQIANEIREQGVDMLLIPDTLVAANHAAEKGFIAESSLVDIEASVQADLPSNPIEALLDEATS